MYHLAVFLALTADNIKKDIYHDIIVIVGAIFSLLAIKYLKEAIPTHVKANSKSENNPAKVQLLSYN